MLAYCIQHHPPCISSPVKYFTAGEFFSFRAVKEVEITRKAINIGILAHADAGKTSLDGEPAIYVCRTIFRTGERQKERDSKDGHHVFGAAAWITIQAAVFLRCAGTDVKSTLWITPGHALFLAEVCTAHWLF